MNDIILFQYFTQNYIKVFYDKKKIRDKLNHYFSQIELNINLETLIIFKEVIKRMYYPHVSFPSYNVANFSFTIIDFILYILKLE